MKNTIKKLILLLMTVGAMVLSGCGGGGGGGGSAAPTTQTPPTTTPPPTTQTPSPTGLSGNLNDLTRGERLSAIRADQRLGSVTQSAGGNEQVGARLSSGSLVIEGTGSSALTQTLGDVFTLNGRQEYLVSGFWHQSDSNFGVFADGSDIGPLPNSGNATYEGEALALVWEHGSDEAADEDAGLFEGDATFTAQVSGGDVLINGSANDFQSVGTLENRVARTGEVSNTEIRFEQTTYNNGIVGGVIDCGVGCNVDEGSWGGQFAISPAAGSGSILRCSGDSCVLGITTSRLSGWPLAFIGTFGARFTDSEGTFDVLGIFETTHNNAGLRPASSFFTRCFANNNCR